jgi:hypothetical protein
MRGSSEPLGETEKGKVSLNPGVVGVLDGASGKEAGTDEKKEAVIRSKEDALDRLRWWKFNSW